MMRERTSSLTTAMARSISVVSPVLGVEYSVLALPDLMPTMQVLYRVRTFILSNTHDRHTGDRIWKARRVHVLRPPYSVPYRAVFVTPGSQ